MESNGTMTGQQVFLIVLLFIVLMLFAWGRWRHDVVALFALFCVVAAGLVPGDVALSGFGHPAVVTVAAVLIISRALRHSGIVDLISTRLTAYTEHTVTHIAVLTGTVALASAFMNNVGALALLLPVAMTTAIYRKRSPALLLMPLAFGSLLGGMLTMIGTPPNVIIATYRADLLGEPFGMFDFTPVGGVVALVGIAYIALLGWRLIPLRKSQKNNNNKRFEIGDYIMEVRAPEHCKLIGKPLREIERLTRDEVTPVGVIRGKDRYMHPAPWRRINIDDLLIVKADPTVLKNLIDEYKLELVASRAAKLKEVKVEDLRLIEAAVIPGSPLEQRNTGFLRRSSCHSLSLIAIARQGESIRTRLREQFFQAGDVLLLQGDADSLHDHLQNLNLAPLAERELNLDQTRRAGRALAIFGIALLFSALGWLPTAIAFIGAILGFLLFKVLPLRDLYRDINWPVIVLLGAMISVGQALQDTGTTEVIVSALLWPIESLPALAILALVMILTMALTDIINNAATALVMAPIAVGIAQQLGVNPDAFLMGVAVAASCAFLTPIGHQSNTLVMGPGGYRFGDYWRMGLPLEILIILVGVPMIALVWPL